MLLSLSESFPKQEPFSQLRSTFHVHATAAGTLNNESPRLMAACGDGNIASAGGVIAIPGDIRVRHYGIGRDPFSAAHPMLRRFGLLDVIETNRHLDGRGVDYAADGAHLHRLSLLPDGFQENALEKVAAVLSRSHTG